MNKSLLNFDLKSLITGLLFATAAFLIFYGFPTRAQIPESKYAIDATEDGVYIMRDGFVVFREKTECRKAWGCSIHNPPK